MECLLRRTLQLLEICGGPRGATQLGPLDCRAATPRSAADGDHRARRIPGERTDHHGNCRTRAAPDAGTLLSHSDGWETDGS